MGLAHLDTSLAEKANALAVHHDGLEDVARAYAAVSEMLFSVAVVLLVAVALVRRRPREAATGALATAAAGVALLIAHVASVLVDRPRPFVDHHQIHSFLHHAADASFPSDHATAAFAIAGVLVLRHRAAGVVALVAAAALAVSRVLVGLHYPGDVLAGASIGLASAYLVLAVAGTDWVAAWTRPLEGRLARRAHG